MTRGGRPLRFALLVLGGWMGVRVAMLWPQTGSLPQAVRIALPVSLAKSRPGTTPKLSATSSASHRVLPPRSIVRHPARRILEPIFALAPASRRNRKPAPAPRPLAERLHPNTRAPQHGQRPLLGTPPHSRRSHRRWRGSAWLFAHGNGTQQTGAARLGGSQAGARITYAIDAGGSIAAAARISTPLEGKGAEASVGLEWRPLDVPVALLAEQRIGLDGQQGGPAIILVAGSGPEPVVAGLDLETYGEAGVVFRDRTDYFAAGAARLSREVANVGNTPIAIGIGAWGSMQRDASRFDIGPSVTVPLPVDDSNVRLSLDWRQRIAGDARPGSGPALTLGADF